MLKYTSTALLIITIANCQDGDSSDNESWSNPASPRTNYELVDMSLTESTNSTNYNSSPMSLTGSNTSSAGQSPCISNTSSPIPSKPLQELLRNRKGKGTITPEEYEALLASKNK